MAVDPVFCVRCVIACNDFNGEPDFFFCKVVCEDLGSGNHYALAIEYAEHEGYEPPFVVFDQYDGPDWLFERFVWDSATIIKAQ